MKVIKQQKRQTGIYSLRLTEISLTNLHKSNMIYFGVKVYDNFNNYKYATQVALTHIEPNTKEVNYVKCRLDILRFFVKAGTGTLLTINGTIEYINKIFTDSTYGERVIDNARILRISMIKDYTDLDFKGIIFKNPNKTKREGLDLLLDNRYLFFEDTNLNLFERINNYKSATSHNLKLNQLNDEREWK